jgi:hypothetical protein
VQTDRDADVGHGPVGGPQQRRCALHPARQEVCMRWLTEHPPELTAEVSPGQAGGSSQLTHVQPLEVPRVDKVLGAQQVPGWREGSHR